VISTGANGQPPRYRRAVIDWPASSAARPSAVRSA
jgi:hypothetical protein